MGNKNFLNFAIKLLLKDRKEHFLSFFIFFFIIFILSGVLFISDSIKHDLLVSLSAQHEIVVKNTKAGQYEHITDEHLDAILQINGVKNVIGKVDGYYYFSQDRKYFHIIGTEDMDDESIKVSKQIRHILDGFYYKKEFNFLTQEGIINLKIKDDFNSNILSNDAIFVSVENARAILGMSEDEYSYLEVIVPNDSEIEYISLRIEDKFPSLRATTKEILTSKYKHIFYYKGGIFMIVYIVAMISFFILLKQQFSSVFGQKRKEIAILRSLGYAIKDIIYLKFVQNSIVALSSFAVGIFCSYTYIFFFDAPLLRNIFLGSDVDFIAFTPVIDFKIVAMIFIFSVIPFLASILIPSWKVAIEDMSEVMK